MNDPFPIYDPETHSSVPGYLWMVLDYLGDFSRRNAPPSVAEAIHKARKVVAEQTTVTDGGTVWKEQKHG